MAVGADRRNPADRGHVVRRARGRKDTKRWCRGKTGVEHQPVIVRSDYDSQPGRVCGPAPDWYSRARALRHITWNCRHREECSECGRVLRRGLVDDIECPDRPEA